jgi:hypothetical protein
MHKAILINEHSGSNRLLYETVSAPQPAADEVRIRHQADFDPKENPASMAQNRLG